MTNVLTAERPFLVNAMRAPPLPADAHALLPVTAPDTKLYERAMSIGASLAQRSRALAASRGPQAVLTGPTQWIATHQNACNASAALSGIVGAIGSLVTIGVASDGNTTAATIVGAISASLLGWCGFALTNEKRRRRKTEKQNAIRITTRDIAPLLRQVEALPPHSRAAYKPALRSALDVMSLSLSAKAHSDLSGYLASIPDQPDPVEARAVQVATALQHVLAAPKTTSQFLGYCRAILADARAEERQALATFIERTLFKNEQPVAAFDDERAIYAFIRELKEPPADPSQ